MYDAVDDPYTYENSTVLVKRSNCGRAPKKTLTPAAPSPEHGHKIRGSVRKFDAVGKICAMPLTSIVSPFAIELISDKGFLAERRQHTGTEPGHRAASCDWSHEQHGVAAILPWGC